MVERVQLRDRAATLVTALFADVSGFTTLAHALDTDDLHEIVHPLIRRLTAVAERAGGLLVKFGGDAILCVFADDDDADHATRAIDAALAMHHALEALKTELPEAGRTLAMHIGVGTGALPVGLELDGVLSDRAILGESVELAQRVESQTPTGSTYVAGATAALVGDRFTFEFVGERELRGFDEPVPLWEVTGRGEGHAVSEELTAHALTDLHRAMRDDGGAHRTEVEQRRVVTVVFADPVVEVEGRDPRALVLEAAEHLGSICERYGAHVGRYAGDAVLAFFGAPVTHEDDADRALLAAMGMHDACRQLSEAHGADVRVRVGVNTGRVIADHFGGEVRSDFSILGDAVNTAQRIEASAPLGETYVSKSTQTLTTGRFAFEFAGRLQLKGKPKPVPAWRLTGAGSVHRSRARDRDRVSFVGRGPELERLQAAVDRLDEGGSATLAVLGEPGVGKTRLTRELSTRVQDTGYRWRTGQCISYGASVPYWPFADLVRRALDLRIDADDRQALERIRAALAPYDLEADAPLLGRLLGVRLQPDPLADLDPAALQRGIAGAVSRWLVAAARGVPTVIAIEDVQWIDAASADVLEDVIRATVSSPVAFYLTSRPEGRDAVDRFVAASRTSSVVELAPFGVEDTDLLIEAILGGEVDDAFSASIAQRTLGNPLFTTEVVRTLLEHEQLEVDRAGQWVPKRGWHATTIPDSVESVIGARIDRLPPRTANVLTVGSVIGRRILLPVLARLVPEVELDAEIEALMRSGFVDPADDEDEVLIHHALVQDVAYARLVRRRRKELHRQVATIAERIYGDGDEVIDLLARHLYMGDAGSKAISYLERAGRRAKSLYANEQAIDHLQHAIELAGSLDDEQRRLTELLLDLGDVQDLVGRLEDARHAFDEARRRADDGRASRGLASVLRKLGRHEESLAAAARGAAVATADEIRVQLLLERAWTLTRLARFDESDAVLVAATLGPLDVPPSLRAEVLLQRATNADLRDDHAAAVALADAALAILEAERDLRRLARAFRLKAQAHRTMGQNSAAAEALQRALPAAEAVGDAEEVASILGTLGVLQFFLDQPDRSIATLRDAIARFHAIGQLNGETTATNNLAVVESELGRIDAAATEAEAALRLARQLDDDRTTGDVLDTLAVVRRAQGRFRDAADHALEAAAIFERLGATARAIEYYGTAIAALEECGDAPAAAALRDRVARLRP